MIMAGIGRACFESSCRINHFGMKPDSGGSPPRDKRVIKVRMVRSGDLDEEVAIELILVELNVLNRRKVVRVMIIYRSRLSCVRLGE